MSALCVELSLSVKSAPTTSATDPVILKRKNIHALGGSKTRNANWSDHPGRISRANLNNIARQTQSANLNGNVDRTNPANRISNARPIGNTCNPRRTA